MAERIKLSKKRHRRLSTILKMQATEAKRPMSIVAIYFDLERTELAFTAPLRARIDGVVDLQYSLIVPDIKSWGVFAAEREMDGVSVFSRFKHDERFHKKKRLKKTRRLPDGTTTKQIFVLRRKGDIELQDDDDTLEKWCKRVDQSRSGHTLLICVNDTPADPRCTCVELTCHLSVASVPPVTVCKSSECKEAKTSELNRKIRARAKHRKAAEKAAKNAIQNAAGKQSERKPRGRRVRKRGRARRGNGKQEQSDDHVSAEDDDGDSDDNGEVDVGAIDAGGNGDERSAPLRRSARIAAKNNSAK